MLKLKAVWSISILTFLLAMQFCAFADNSIIVNGDFENGTTGWYKDAGVFTISSEEKYSGNSCAKLSNRTATWNAINTNIIIETNKTYTYCVYIKAGEVTNNKFYIMLYDQTKKQYYSTNNETVISNSKWTKIWCDFKIIDNINNQVNVKLSALEVVAPAGRIVETVYYDNFQVAPKYTATSVKVEGKTTVEIPISGEKFIPYSCIVNNQFDNMIEMDHQNVIWEIKNQISGIMIDSNGVLKVSHDALPGSIIISVGITEYGIEKTGEIQVNIRPYGTDKGYAKIDADTLIIEDITSQSLNCITKDLNLPTKGEHGTDIKWVSNNENIITHEGKILTQRDTSVRMVATVSDEFNSVSKEFDFVVRSKRNIISNGGFEENIGNEWWANTCKKEICISEKHNGLQSIKISERTASWQSIRQTVTVENNKFYRYSVWVKLPEGVQEKTFMFFSEPYVGLQYITGSSVTGKWSQITGVFKIEGETNATTTFSLFLMEKSGGVAETIYMDDWIVTEEGNLYADADCYSADDTKKSGDIKIGDIDIYTYLYSPKNDMEISILTTLYDKFGKLLNVNIEKNKIYAGIDNVFKNRVVSGNYDINIVLLENLETLKPLIPKTHLPKLYYVSQSGDDSYEGTIRSPFKTLSKAESLMEPGDVCIVREGIYRESVIIKKSGLLGQPIKFMAYPGEKVEICGADEIKSIWSESGNNIYKTEYMDNITQMYIDGKIMNIARWPNAEPENLLDINNYATVSQGEHEYICANNLPDKDWEGAKVHIWPGPAWYYADKKISYNSTDRKLIFEVPFVRHNNGYDGVDFMKPSMGNKFYIYDTKAALDAPREWVKVENELSIYSESNPNNSKVEVKARDWGFDVGSNSYIELEGFNLFGCSIRIENGQGCVIDNCVIKYPSDDVNKSVTIKGNNNIIKNCAISYAPGNGILLEGISNTIDNCIIHDVNLVGAYCGAIDTKGKSNVIRNNTLYNSGRYLVMHYDTENMQLIYNDMYGGGKLTNDLGATYAWNSDGKGSIIAYNIIHDMDEKAGIYLDNFCSNYSVHHNVLFNLRAAIILNSDSVNNNIYNNTMANIWDSAFSTYTYSGYESNQAGTKIYNNIVSGKTVIVTGINAPYLSNNERIQLDGNFLYGSGIMDIGAYESGEKYWSAGSVNVREE